MQLTFRSLLSVAQLKDSDLNSIFALASKLKQTQFEGAVQSRPRLPVVVEAFFEPSTRTRLSFQIAAARLGLSMNGFEWQSSSSLVKEESEEDTLLNIAAMKPDLLILRAKGTSALKYVVENLNVPVVIAGWGTDDHPTQALLDIWTLIEALKDLKGKKIVFVGDVGHSRVANSTAQLAQHYGMQIGVCAPQEFLPTTPRWAQAKTFSFLEEAAAWADIVVGLRVQKERHSKGGELSLNDYISKFRLDAKNLKDLHSEARILHPGPFVPNVDFDPQLLSDTRCLVHRQVENGVYIRAALMSLLIGLETEKSV